MGSWPVAASIPIPLDPPLMGTAEGLQGEEQRWLQATFVSHNPRQACLRCAGSQAAPWGPWCQPRVTGCNTFGFLPASSPWLCSLARGCSESFHQPRSLPCWCPHPEGWEQPGSLLLHSLARGSGASSYQRLWVLHSWEMEGTEQGSQSCFPGKFSSKYSYEADKSPISMT